MTEKSYGCVTVVRSVVTVRPGGRTGPVTNGRSSFHSTGTVQVYTRQKSRTRRQSRVPGSRPRRTWETPVKIIRIYTVINNMYDNNI